MTLRNAPSADQRFDAKVDVDSATGCWLWTASTNSAGYGMFYPNDRRGQRSVTLAHRWAYARARGPIPRGLLVCHTCDTPTCVNPEHMFLGTHRDNTADMVAKGRANSPRKLSPADVEEVRSSFTGAYGQQAVLARRFGVSPPTIHRVLGR